MSESKYQPRYCAFHPKELIFNFCKNSECLLPLCPSCVKVHSQEHKIQKSYGQFENIHKVVNDLDSFFADSMKELDCYLDQIKEHFYERGIQQEQLKKKIYEARIKMVTLVERFFNDFEKEVSKSVVSYNDSMKQNYGKVDQTISKLKTELQNKSLYLSNEKVLKTIIGFYAKNQQSSLRGELDAIKARIEELGQQRVSVICVPNTTQNVVDELGHYIHLSFQNWQNDIKYASEFVKMGTSNNSTGNSFHNPLKA